MGLKRFAISALAFSAATFLFTVPAHATGTPSAAPSAVYGQEGQWDAPPPEFREARLQGFHDGIEGARKDFDNHRAPDVNNREEYRHPHVSGSLREDYRDGFRRGYDRAMSHMMGGNYHSQY